jgi:hypothetical protein
VCIKVAIASTDFMSYYQVGPDASECDTYINNNSESYIAELSTLSRYYSNGDYLNINKIVAQKKFSEYVENLSECSLIYRYVGDANYFRTAHAYSLLLVDIVSNPKREYKESAQRVNDIVVDISDELHKIKISKKIKR